MVGCDAWGTDSKVCLGVGGVCGSCHAKPGTQQLHSQCLPTLCKHLMQGLVLSPRVLLSRAHLVDRKTPSWLPSPAVPMHVYALKVGNAFS